MASMTFQWDSKELDARLAELPEKLAVRIRETVDNTAKRAEIEMKVKAPWTDRGESYASVPGHRNYVSEHARAGLFAHALHEGLSGGIERHTIVCGHTASYGIYLETIKSGKWQIVMPTVKAAGEACMASMIGLLSELDVTTPLADIEPGYGERGTSQGPDVYVERTGRAFRRTFTSTIRRSLRGRVYAQYRDIKTGRYISHREARLRGY